jgi:hypothetical protein
LLTDVSGQRIGRIFKGQEVQEEEDQEVRIEQLGSHWTDFHKI